MASCLILFNCVVLFALMFGNVVCPNSRSHSGSSSRVQPLPDRSSSDDSSGHNHRMNGVNMRDVTSDVTDAETRTILDHGRVAASFGHWHYYDEKNWNKETGKVNLGASPSYSYNINAIRYNKRRDGSQVHFSCKHPETGKLRLVTLTFANERDAKCFNEEEEDCL